MNTLAFLPIQISNTWQTAKAACLELSADQSDRYIVNERLFDSSLAYRLDSMDFKNILRDLLSLELA